MKKTVLLLFTFCLCTVANAQNTFEKVIDTLGSDYASCIKETFDGGYVYCGKSNYNGNDVIIVKLDSTGTIEWGKTYSGPSIEAATYIEQTPDSGYLVNALYDGGSIYAKSWLLRLNINGDTLWTKIFSLGTGATNPSINNSMATINNTVYGLTGYYKPFPVINESAYFIATTNSGFQLASKTYNPSTIFSADSRSIDKTYDDGFIMAGTVATSLSTSDVYLIRTNTFGDTLWTRTYDHTTTDAAFDVKQTNDSGFIVTGITFPASAYNIWLIKTDSSGDTLWTKSYFSPYEQSALSVKQTTDGGYIITGTVMNSAMERNLYLIKTNSLGDTLWTRKFDVSINCFGYFVGQTKDGGFIISGLSNMPPGGTIVIKTDSMGNVNLPSGIAEVNNPFSFIVFPNPAKDSFTIEAKGIAKHGSTFNVYNITNQCIYTGAIYNNVTQQVNLNNLANGIYMVVLNTDNKVYSKKIIIQK